MIIMIDGRMFFGGDDKVGIVIIMELVNMLMEIFSIFYGDICIFFICDEEIGCGVDFVDLERVNVYVVYIFDGGGVNVIDVEMFLVDFVIVRFLGINIYFLIVKDCLVNLICIVGDFVFWLVD